MSVVSSSVNCLRLARAAASSSEVQLSPGGVVTASSPDHFRAGAHEEIEALIGG
jgi:hypothetical protein